MKTTEAPNPPDVITITTISARQMPELMHPIQPADKNPAYAYLSGLTTHHGRRTMQAALNNVAQMLSGNKCSIDTFPWHKLDFAHVQAVRAWLVERKRPATVNKYLAALRGVLRAAWQLGLIDTDRYQRAAAIKGVRNDTLPAGREVTGGELAALMSACAADDSEAGTRDAAIIALMYAGGLRRAEVVALDLADYDPESGALKVTGKGRKERLLWVTNGAKDALADWLATRGDFSGALFVPLTKSGRIQWRRMTEQAIYNILRKRARSARVKSFSPHDLRRSFVSALLDAGADIVTVQKMAGHSNVQTTARYDRRGEAAKRDAAKLLHVPYVRAAQQKFI